MKRVLICPLDWGLGHAARCLPIIKMLIDKGAEVIIAADNGPLAFLKIEFPQLKFIEFPGYNITYPAKGSMLLKMLFSIPKIVWGIYKEHRMLANIVKENNIDIVISDNRYGLWNKKIDSVFITHQLIVKCPGHLKFCEGFLHRIIKWFIKHYDECWIPDFEDEINLSGDLSHKYRLPSNSYYINPLSRFNNSTFNIQHSTFKIDLLIILSGPEPQRTILESMLSAQCVELTKNKPDLKVVIVRGKAYLSESSNLINLKNLMNLKIDVYSHLETDKLLELINNAGLIICRSGYSSIMDLAALGKNAVFIPTPGQTEQEYLAEYLFKEGWFYYKKQNEFNLLEAIKESGKYCGIKLDFDNSLLEKRIAKLLTKD